MDQYVDFFPELALAAALLLAALAAAPLFERIRLPSPAAFLAVGMAAGLLEIAPTSDLSVVRLEQVGAVALFVILFQGGLSTGFNAARAAVRPILSLGIVGTAATACGLAVVAHFVLSLDWSIALLIGVALAPTDPAAVYAVLRGRSGSERARTILEGESGFNDPAGIALMVAVTAAVTAGHASVRPFGRQVRRRARYRPSGRDRRGSRPDLGRASDTPPRRRRAGGRCSAWCRAPRSVDGDASRQRLPRRLYRGSSAVGYMGPPGRNSTRHPRSTVHRRRATRLRHAGRGVRAAYRSR